MRAAVWNAGFGVWKPFLEITPDEVQTAVDTNVVAAFAFAREAILAFKRNPDDNTKKGTLIFTGATASIRGSAKFANFAAGKFAARAITQSLAREFGPRGVHVAHAIIDGGIDIPRLAEYKHKFNNGAPDGLISPDSVSGRFCAGQVEEDSAC